MSPRAVHHENPDRLYTVTGGRSRVGDDIDLVALVVAESDPSRGTQSEHVKILRMCSRPTAVVEISSELGLPVSVVKILVCDLLDMGSVSVRQPSVPSAQAEVPDPELLRQVLVGLHRL